MPEKTTDPTAAKTLSQNKMSGDKKKLMLSDKAFLDQVAARVYELMVADLRREQERRGGK